MADLHHNGVEKTTHLMGLRMAGQLPGESIWLNQALHIISALLGWLYMRQLKLANPASENH